MPPSRPVPAKTTIDSRAVLLRDLVVALLDESRTPRPTCMRFPRICRHAALLGVALHRMQYAARVVHVVLERQAAYAQAALRDRMVFVAFNLDELSALIGHVKLQRRSLPDGSPGATTAHVRVTVQSVLLVAPRLIEVVFILADREFATRV